MLARASVLLLTTAACVSHVPRASSPLAEKMRAELQRDRPLDSPGLPLAGLRDRHFLFVGGFLNETIPGYFADNIAVVAEELGAETSVVFPSSTADVSADADLIRDAVNAALTRSGKPVVLVGHSKGGAAALLAALRTPELLLSGRIDKVIAIQGAFGGSPVADSLLRNVPLHFRGLESLTRARSRTLFRIELEKLRDRLSEDELERLSSRVFYVRSQESVNHVVPELLLTHQFLAGFGENDGLLLQADMKLDAFGVDLGVLRGDHAAFTVSSALANSTRAERKAFTRALLREVVER